MTQSADHLLQYFGCSVIEDWIACRWHLVPDENKAELGQFLYNFILNNYKVRPSPSLPIDPVVLWPICLFYFFASSC